MRRKSTVTASTNAWIEKTDLHKKIGIKYRKFKAESDWLEIAPNALLMLTYIFCMPSIWIMSRMLYITCFSTIFLIWKRRSCQYMAFSPISRLFAPIEDAAEMLFPVRKHILASSSTVFHCRLPPLIAPFHRRLPQNSALDRCKPSEEIDFIWILLVRQIDSYISAYLNFFIQTLRRMAEHTTVSLLRDEIATHNDQLICAFDQKPCHAVGCVVEFGRIVDITQNLQQYRQRFDHSNRIGVIQWFVESLQWL